MDKNLNLAQLKQDIATYIGERVELKTNEPRRRGIIKEGILENTYSNLFASTPSLGKKTEELTISVGSDDKYLVTEDIGATTAGSLAVIGATDGDKRAVIDFDETNRYSGFVLDNDDTTLMLKNVEVKNSSNLIYGNANDNVKIVLDNVDLHDNGTGITTFGDIDIKGNSKISDDIEELVVE